MARGLFRKAIAQSDGSRDSVLTARPMREDGVDPNYPVSAETIGTEFGRSMGIEADEAALAKLRALSSEEVIRGAQTQPATRAPPHETTPILDGKLITETAESANKVKRHPRVPIIAGSNSADTAGNRVGHHPIKDLIFEFRPDAEAGAIPDVRKARLDVMQLPPNG